MDDIIECEIFDINKFPKHNIDHMLLYTDSYKKLYIEYTSNSMSVSSPGYPEDDSIEIKYVVLNI